MPDIAKTLGGGPKGKPEPRARPGGGPDFPSSLGELLDRFLGRDLPEDVQTGPGILGVLDPSGTGLASGIAKASLPLLGRKAGSFASNVADDPAFWRRILGEADVAKMDQAFEQAGTFASIEKGEDMAHFFKGLADIAGRANKPPLLRSSLLGASEASQSQIGRALMDLIGGDGAQAIRQADRAAIETLIEQSRGFIP